MLLQTSLIFRMFPGVMEHHAIATSELVFLLESVPSDAAPVVLSAYSSASRAAYVRDGFPAQAKHSSAMSEPFQNLPANAAYDLSGREARFRTIRGAELSQSKNLLGDNTLVGMSALEVSIQLEDQRVLTVLLTPPAIIGYYGLPLFGLFFLTIAAASLLSLFLLFRPLKRLEAATTSIGQTSKPHLIKEEGSEDIRRVARALNAVQERVSALISERSRMVAAMAHDVRTSLTHMKLRLDDAQETDMDALQDDIRMMEALIGDMVLYARSEQTNTAPELVELGELIETTLEAVPFQVEQALTSQSFRIAGDPPAIRRALVNLIQNAKDYGDQPRVASKIEDGTFLISIEDEGPGIPSEELEQVFDPFYRLDPSRNRATGGSGLGLSIAKSLLGAQGAILSLSNKDEGGLIALIRFPERTRVI
ncbi:MAG: ATP-binding protein [Pseudomonadota bacterium]